MFKIIVEHLDFSISIIAYTPKAETHLRHFIQNLPRGYRLVDKTEPSWRLILITSDFSPLKAADLLSETEKKLWTGYQQIWNSLDSIRKGDALINLDNPNQEEGKFVFVQLVPKNISKKKESALLANFLLSLNKRWMLKTGALPVHASAISYKNRGYLFTGPSGAGKTTIALLSMDISDSILHDEKIFIIPENDSYKLLGSPDYNRRRWPRDYAEKKEIPEEGIPINPDHKVSLTAVFVLKQNIHDYLRPLSSLAVAHALITGYLDVSKNIKISVDNKHVIHSFCELSRHIPGYELNFRKSNDFFKVIDKHFPS
jgi:hypothetical protein